jgi:hypothetical protein
MNKKEYCKTGIPAVISNNKLFFLTSPFKNDTEMTAITSSLNQRMTRKSSDSIV